MTRGQLRTRLKAVGMARRNHLRTGEAIAERIRGELRAAEGAIGVSEAARLLGMHRSTVYRLMHEQ